MKTNAKHKLKGFVAWRDKHKCFWCGRKVVTVSEAWPTPFNMATLDHVVPKSKGGRTTAGNLVLSCFPCNNDRGDLPADEYLIAIHKRSA